MSICRSSTKGCFDQFDASIPPEQIYVAVRFPELRFVLLAGLTAALLTIMCFSESSASATVRFRLIQVSHRSELIHNVGNVNSLDKSTADEQFEPELTEADLNNIERGGGQSGLDCSIARRTLPMVFKFRQMGTPLDEARRYMYDRSNGQRSNQFMYDTVDQIYGNPVKIEAMIKNGHWSHACVKYIRGF